MNGFIFCILDLIRSYQNKSNKIDMSCNHGDIKLIEKYQDLKNIYFSDNLTMTKKNDMRSFLPKNIINCRPNLSFGSGFESETSDIYCNSVCVFTDSENEGCAATDWSKSDQNFMDSVCTLCTSSFSYNNGSCIYCINAAYDSKCDTSIRSKNKG